jgi:hypothetical protein
MSTGILTNPGIIVVGAAGFEPAASWSRTKRAAKLRYAPIYCTFKIIP